jgi:hypothetical protein
LHQSLFPLNGQSVETTVVAAFELKLDLFVCSSVGETRY